MTIDYTKVPLPVELAPKIGDIIAYISLDTGVLIGRVTVVHGNMAYYTIDRPPDDWSINDRCEWAIWDEDHWRINPRLAWGKPE